MAKLHEVLAVENELGGIDTKIREETAATFSKKAEHFIGWHKRYEPLDENDADGKTPDENHEMVTTVRQKLDYMFEHVARYIDAVYQKECTNQNATADIIIDGVIIAAEMPATFLLGLESKLKKWREVFDAIPTLPPGTAVELDPTQGAGVYVSKNDESRRKTKKTVNHKVLYEATKDHPAQIEKWNDDVVIGWTHTKAWYGFYSPAEKSEVLGRLDALARAVKQARQRANCQEVTNDHVGDALINYIMGVLPEGT